MKKLNILILILLISIAVIISACDRQEVDIEEQRIDLYVEVMKSVFETENGGDDFIAIKLDTLEGLNPAGKDIVLESFKDLSSNVYDFEDIKNDEGKFEFDGNEPLRTINGTVLWIDLKECENNRVKIMATSWFGDLGSAKIEYSATYKNKAWKLNKTFMLVS